jgi:hypothetical protein
MTSLWDQRLAESDSEYRAFRRWLDASPRTSPAEPDLAIRHDWSSRAQAFDALRHVPTDPAAAFQALINTTLQGAIVAADLYLRGVLAGTIEPDPRHPVQVINALARVQEVWQARPSDAPELFHEDLPTEVLEIIDEIKLLKAGIPGRK